MVFPSEFAKYLPAKNYYPIFTHMKTSLGLPQTFSRVLIAALLITAFQTTRVTAKDFATAQAQAKVLLQQMTLAEKIGQMTQADSDALKKNPGDVEKYFLGSE